jgi:hypothetical protein
MDMKKRSFKKLITLSLTLAMLTGVAGCGKQQSLNAETNPDTPVSDVQFPLKEKAELSFITSAPATQTRIFTSINYLPFVQKKTKPIKPPPPMINLDPDHNNIINTNNKYPTI